jgi:hypothetical protein
LNRPKPDFSAMKPLHVIAALVVAVAALVSFRPGFATEYATNPNPACRLLRNNTIGAPFPAEPNRADTRAAMARAGREKSPLNALPANRRMFAEAFPLIQKVDAEGTAALSELPSSTPRIDFVIDKHLTNLTWARVMLGVFYEEGRAPPIDYAAAAKFYQKSIDTQFVDDRGCVHGWPPTYATLMHLAGFYAYGLGVPQDRGKAKEFLRRAGPRATSIVYLLDHDALPKSFNAYLTTDLDRLAGAVKTPQAGTAQNPQPVTSSDIVGMFFRLPDPNTEFDTAIGLLWQGLLWLGGLVAFLIAAYVMLRLIRRDNAGKEKTGFYRAIFAAYDVIHNAVSRLGLVAGGVIGCVVGLWMLLEAYALRPFGSVIAVMVGFSGLIALLGGIAKFVEAARLGLAANNTNVHGAARPAPEPEAHAAARGAAKATDPHDRTFSD